MKRNNLSNNYDDLKNSNTSKQKKDIKSLVPIKKKSPATDIEPIYPLKYEGTYTDPTYGDVIQNNEKQLFRYIFSTLRKHWLMILSINLLITGISIVYVAQKPDYFTSVARVQVNAENNPATGGRNNTNPIIVSNPGADPAYFTTQLQILESAGLLRRVIKTLDLENNQSFLDPQNERKLSVLQNVQRMFGFNRSTLPPTPPSNTAKPLKNKLNLKNDKSIDIEEETEKYAPLVSHLKSNLVIMPVKDSRTSNRETRLIEIQYTHGDPIVAAKIANTIGEAYVLQNLEQKVLNNASAGDFLQKRVAELQSEIRLGEERLINYSKKNQILSLDSSQNTVVQRLADLNLKLGQAENERITAQAAYQAAQQNQMRTVTAENRDTQVVGLEGKLNELRQKLSQLKTEYTDEWFEVQQTQKQIESVENQLATIRKRASDIQISTLEERLNETIAREKELRENFEKQRADVLKQNEASINYKIIQQEIDTNKTLLDSLLQRSRENDVIMNGISNNVLVIDHALTPRSPMGPDRSRGVILAFLASLFVGCGLAFFLDWFNDSIQHSENIESELGIPLLAAIPLVPMGLSSRLNLQNLLFRKRKKIGKGLSNLWLFEHSAISEAYMQLRTLLLLSNPGGPPRTILVTSGEESEGKTVTAINLAINMAKTGDKILLIDADLRCPRIHHIMELNNKIGLTQLLTTEKLTDEFIDEAVQTKKENHLEFLTAGERSANPAVLLSSKEMEKLLEKLSERYTHIIIDSPPVLYFADSSIISSLVDSVIFVVRDNISSKHSILKAKKILQNVGANIVGVIINGIPRQWSNYGKYDHYGEDLDIQVENGIEPLKLN